MCPNQNNKKPQSIKLLVISNTRQSQSVVGPYAFKLSIAQKLGFKETVTKGMFKVKAGVTVFLTTPKFILQRKHNYTVKGTRFNVHNKQNLLFNLVLSAVCAIYSLVSNFRAAPR